MAQSLVRNYVHIVFSTKGRAPLIYAPFEKKLYSYLAGICSEHDCHALKIGGYKNHIHILCRLSKNLSLVELIKQIKMGSSKYMKTLSSELSQFYWQKGYAAFSVCERQLTSIENYISNQHEHHEWKSFEDEYIEILDENELEYDRRFMWE